MRYRNARRPRVDVAKRQRELRYCSRDGVGRLGKSALAQPTLEIEQRTLDVAC